MKREERWLAIVIFVDVTFIVVELGGKAVVHQKHFLQLDSQSMLQHVISNATTVSVTCSFGYLLGDYSSYLTFHSMHCLNGVSK